MVVDPELFLEHGLNGMRKRGVADVVQQCRRTHQTPLRERYAAFAAVQERQLHDAETVLVARVSSCPGSAVRLANPAIVDSPKESNLLQTLERLSFNQLQQQPVVAGGNQGGRLEHGSRPTSTWALGCRAALTKEELSPRVISFVFGPGTPPSSYPIYDQTSVRLVNCRPCPSVCVSSTRGPESRNMRGQTGSSDCNSLIPARWITGFQARTHRVDARAVCSEILVESRPKQLTSSICYQAQSVTRTLRTSHIRTVPRAGVASMIDDCVLQARFRLPSPDLDRGRCRVPSRVRWPGNARLLFAKDIRSGSRGGRRNRLAVHSDADETSDSRRPDTAAELRKNLDSYRTFGRRSARPDYNSSTPLRVPGKRVSTRCCSGSRAIA